jgi:peptidoglycan/xylan/chitin deacetylase (PgdA/CDA1 family)
MAQKLYPCGVPHGLMFHRFQSSRVSSTMQGTLTAEDLDRVLRYVGIERILSADEWMIRLGEARLEPGDLCVTFDDGLRSQVDHALPVLDAHGIRAFWFVYTCVFEGQFVKSEIYSQVADRIGGMAAMTGEFLGRCPVELLALLRTPSYAAYAAGMRAIAPFYSEQDLEYRFLRNNPASQSLVETLMDQVVEALGFDPEEIAAALWIDPDDVRALAASGHIVGLHSYSHPYAIGTMDAAAQHKEYHRNAEDLAALIGTAPASMSHPLDSYNQDSLSVLRELGIRCGFRANMSTVPRVAGTPSVLELPREDASTLLSRLPLATASFQFPTRSSLA